MIGGSSGAGSEVNCVGAGGVHSIRYRGGVARGGLVELIARNKGVIPTVDAGVQAGGRGRGHAHRYPGSQRSG